MSSLDIVLHTSVQPEPFGRVLIEAMSLAKPLIGAAAGAVPEIIDHGVTGLLFKPGDPLSLSDSIVNLLDDMESASAMGISGFDRLHEKFHIDDCVTKTQRFFESIISQRH
jgi:glycosyltransferase involved in cell wall biosynthesis